MITAHRTHRHFNIDKYLDRQLAQLPACIIAAPEPCFRLQFRGWALRLDARICRCMDAVDWKRIDLAVGTVGGFAITGFVLYMTYVVTNAWLQGRFNFGAN